MRVLIVEDESGLSKSMAAYLREENYSCEIAATFDAAVNKTAVFDYDCILLDITLPDGNGLQLLEALRKDGKTEGVIVISAKDSLDDKINGLNLGADDYIAKPFSLHELHARIAALIRRRRFAGNHAIVVNEITIDTAAKTVSVKHNPVDLTKKEFALLLYLAVNKNRVISKSSIAEHINGDEAEAYDNFDFLYAHIKNLKKKLQSAGADDNIKAIYGMGYKFEVK